MLQAGKRAINAFALHACVSREKKLVELLKKLAVQSGKMALPYYGNIVSQSKFVPAHAHVRETPVTALDHGIQEMVLASLLQHGYDDFAFNGEEDTHLKFFFKRPLTEGVCIHCDPIDGTKAFVDGNFHFCVGFGLSRMHKEKHEFFASVIYDPLAKQLYWAYDGKVSKHEPIVPPQKIAFSRHRLTEAGRKAVQAKGYTFGERGSAHLGIVETALGQSAFCALRHIEIHDALIPYAFARSMGISPVDVDGKKLGPLFDLKIDHHSHKFERIPTIIYFSGKEAQEELLPILQNPHYMQQ
jgi:fructose-1,6-bisphosphatase/inositol monophosphatase family enzyme